MSASNPTRMRIGCAAGAIVLGVSCGGLRGTGSAKPGRSEAVKPSPAEAPQNRDALGTIARCENAQDDAHGSLESFLAGGAESTREHAATALGRLPYPEHGAEVTRALCGALRDESPGVRSAAAFSLGMRADPVAADSILAARNEADPVVRARIVEAASRIDDPRLRDLAIGALGDPSELVRAEAALAPQRWPKEAPDAARFDDALLDFLSGREEHADPEVAWRALFSLARRGCVRARAAFDAGLASDDVRARIFSAQGLRGLPADPGSRDRLRAALADADWRVVCEAVFALGEHPDPAALADLDRTLEHASAHVRRATAETLGRFGDSSGAVRPLLERARVDPSPNVRGAALVSQVRVFGDAFAPEAQAVTERSDPLLRAAAATAAIHLSDELAVPILLHMSRDSHLRVADIAARGLKDHPTPAARARITELLQDVDQGLRLAAAETLKEIGGSGDLEALDQCLASSRGEISAEVAANIVEAAARIGGDRARTIVEHGAAHSDPFVRKKSLDLLARVFHCAYVPTSEPRAEAPSTVPIPGTDYPASGPNPRIEIVTSRGRMVFELFSDETPVHVYNFLELARRGHYDGLGFHRVVPDFVIQGGDPRGDGNGGTTWRGAPLRREFTPRKFVRGSLGMPRNDDPDSGGSQIFVAHRETPHLDGRYTLFGELRDGFDVLDAIEVGDTIRSVRLLDPVEGR